MPMKRVVSLWRKHTPVFGTGIVRELRKTIVTKGLNKHRSCLLRDFSVSASNERPISPRCASPLPGLRSILLAFTKLRAGRQHKRETENGANVSGWSPRVAAGTESRNNTPLVMMRRPSRNLYRLRGAE